MAPLYIYKWKYILEVIDYPWYGYTYISKRPASYFYAGHRH